MAKFPGLELDRIQMREILRSGRKFVVVSRSEGFGDVLFAVAHAWLYCEKTGRTLVIDLANSRYLEDKELNAAGSLLTFPESFGTVNIIAPRRISWNLRRIMGSPWPLRALHLLHPTSYVYARMLLDKLPFRRRRESFLTPAEEKDLIRTGERRREQFLFFRGCNWEQREEVTGFLRAVSPAPELATQLDSFLSMIGGPFVGLHVRYYDPSLAETRHSRFWLDFPHAIGEIVSRVTAASERAGSALPVLLATDSKEVETALSQRLPRVMTLPKSFSDPAAGELHASQARRRGEDAIIEMFALTHAVSLVRYPPSRSWFSELAALTCGHVISE